MKKIFIVVLLSLFTFAYAGRSFASEDKVIGTSSVTKLVSDKDTALADGNDKIRISFGAFYTKDVGDGHSVGASPENLKPICACYSSSSTTCDEDHPLTYSSQNRITFTVSGEGNYLWHPIVQKEMTLLDPYTPEVEKEAFFDENDNVVTSQRYAFWRSFNEVVDRKIWDCSTGYLSFDLHSSKAEEKTIIFYHELQTPEGLSSAKSFRIKVNFTEPSVKSTENNNEVVDQKKDAVQPSVKLLPIGLIFGIASVGILFILKKQKRRKKRR
jgi:hypothetical protein